MLPPLLLVGAGRMGGALFAGWVKKGLAPCVLVDPLPVPGLARAEDVVVGALGEVPAGFAPAAAILAVKPQMADAVMAALLQVAPPGTLVLSIMAGLTLGRIAAAAGSAAVVRAMPNTPASIGQGMSVACAAPAVTAVQRALCHALLEAVGEVAWVTDEALMEPVTTVSGCGPAYVFLLAELLERIGAESGLPPALARTLARRTVSGSGALLDADAADAAELRRAVTSPKGVTEAALAVLMAEDAWPHSLRAAMAAAAARSRELGA